MQFVQSTPAWGTGKYPHFSRTFQERRTASHLRFATIAPDLYATGSGLTIVGEAKPPWDVESARTELQLQSFTKYVEMDSSRHLILSVNWVSTATASAVIRSLARDWPSLKHRVHFLDGRRPLVLPTGHQHHAAD